MLGSVIGSLRRCVIRKVEVMLRRPVIKCSGSKVQKDNLTESVLSDRFRNVAFVCAVMVVAIHLNHGMAGWGRWYDSLYRDGVGRMAVPFFFLASGYFLARKANGISWYKAEIHKRVRSLFVPYFLWQFIFALWLFLVIGANSLQTGKTFSQLWLFDGWKNLSLIGCCYGRYPAMGVLWYIRALLLLVIMSPLLFCAVRKLGVYWLILLYAFDLADVIWPMPWSVFGWLVPMQSILFFCAGCYLCDHKELLAHSIPKGWTLIFLGFLLCLLRMWSGGGAVAVPFLIVGAWQIMRHVTITRKLTDNSFALYLIHLFVLMCWSMIIGRDWQSPIFLVLQFAFALVSSFGIIFLLRRFFPKTINVLFGGR